MSEAQQSLKLPDPGDKVMVCARFGNKELAFICNPDTDDNNFTFLTLKLRDLVIKGDEEAV